MDLGEEVFLGAGAAVFCFVDEGFGAAFAVFFVVVDGVSGVCCWLVAAASMAVEVEMLAGGGLCSVTGAGAVIGVIGDVAMGGSSSITSAVTEGSGAVSTAMLGGGACIMMGDASGAGVDGGAGGEV